MTLSPENFQKTWEDVNFVDRLKLMAADYANYDEEYDENGRCIRGCLYPGITLAEANQLSEKATQESTDFINQWEMEHADDEYMPQYYMPLQTVDSELPAGALITNAQTASNTSQANTGQYSCPSGRYSKFIPRGAQIPMHAPLDSNPLYMSSDYSDARRHPISGQVRAHRAVDLSAPIGTPVYATANGTVITVGFEAGGCGRYIKIKHPASGEITMYCHLEMDGALVRKGDHVIAGCEIAKSGNTGASTGPHLHYAIRNAKNVGVDPVYSINRMGRDYYFTGRTSAIHQGKNMPGRKYK